MHWYMDYVCTNVSNLDLVDIGHNVSATARPMASCNPIQKDLNHLMLWLHNLKIIKNVPHFRFGAFSLILTLDYYRQSLD